MQSLDFHVITTLCPCYCECSVLYRSSSYSNNGPSAIAFSTPHNKGRCYQIYGYTFSGGQ